MICRFVNLPICQFADLSICRFVNLPICQFADLSICRFVNLPICQFVNLLVFSFDTIMIIVWQFEIKEISIGYSCWDSSHFTRDKAR